MQVKAYSFSQLPDPVTEWRPGMLICRVRRIEMTGKMRLAHSADFKDSFSASCIRPTCLKKR
jgi:hypothetical protein